MPRLLPGPALANLHEGLRETPHKRRSSARPGAGPEPGRCWSSPWSAPRVGQLSPEAPRSHSKAWSPAFLPVSRRGGYRDACTPVLYAAHPRSSLVATPATYRAHTASSHLPVAHPRGCHALPSYGTSRQTHGAPRLSPRPARRDSSLPQPIYPPHSRRPGHPEGYPFCIYRATIVQLSRLDSISKRVYFALMKAAYWRSW